ncbi:hypothetical protein ACF0H5_014161 [Mactra antiquata]
MASFGMVDNAVRSVQTVKEYINVGMEITNEVSEGFLECHSDDLEQGIYEFRKTMLEFVMMEQEIKHVQEAVDFVKQQDPDGDLVSMFNNKIDELRSTTDESQLLQHEKIQDFNQKMHDALHPDEDISVPKQGTSNDDDIEVTQEINTKCPYTGMQMVKPVTNKHCGHNYDKDGILQYIKQRKNKAKCPLGGCSNDKPIEPIDLEENKDLKRYIDRLNRKTGKK